MIRARGFRPSASAFSSDMTRIAAAPSLSGHALPAVTVPSGLKAGLSAASFSDRGAGPRPVVAQDGVRGDDVAAGVMQLGDLDADDLAVEVAALARRQRALLGLRRPLVLGLAADRGSARRRSRR